MTVTVRYKDLNLNPLEHEWDINPRLYEGIRNVDYSGMTDLVDVIERKIDDDAIGDGSSRDRDGSGGPHPGRLTWENSVMAKFREFTLQHHLCGRSARHCSARVLRSQKVM